MDNPEKLATKGTEDEEKQKHNNPEKLATKGTEDEEKQKHNTIYVGHHYTETNTNNVNKTSAMLQRLEFND
jgi:hypothetical protein